MPAHGIFVENRLKAFLSRHDAEVRVIAPTPWFPFKADIFGKYAQWAAADRHEIRDGIPIWRPQYLLIPKVGMNAAPTALQHVLKNTLAEFKSEGWVPDFIDAHYFYPDGVAAVSSAMDLSLPVVVTARGSDISELPNYPGPRKKIIAAARAATKIFCVADALKNAIVEHGIDAEKIDVLRNGVDLEVFTRVDKKTAKQSIGLSDIDAPIIASVGHLIERKGHHLAIDALAKLDDVHLVIAGEGEERKRLQEQATNLGLEARVHFLGLIDHYNLLNVYNAADALVLASSREGWPNVLLEAMACGTPCVATPVWGSKEVIRERAAGILTNDRSANSIADALSLLLNGNIDRRATRVYAEQFSWAQTSDAMAATFSDLSEKQKITRAIKTRPLYAQNKTDTYRPKLIVTVDTEEQFDWSNFRSNEHQVNDLVDINRFQTACQNADVKPLYFLSYPILSADKSASYFKRLHDDDDASLGLHLHQWVTPPDQIWGEHQTFQMNLPRKIHRAKLARLADTFEGTIGVRAEMHRAGRYGISPAAYADLAEIGIQHDFSPSAAFDFSPYGGPNFSVMSNRPFALSDADWKIHVIPVCGAKAVRSTTYFVSQEQNPPGFAKTPGNNSKLIAMRLSPEGNTISSLKALTKRLMKDKTPVLTFTLHSTSLTLGANPYAKTPDDIDALLQKTSDYFDWFRNVCGGDIISATTLSDARHQTT